MSKIESVAQAIDKCAQDRGHPLHAAVVRHLAVAAIEAMREPTKEMIEVGNTALEDAIDSDWDSGPDGESHNSYTTVRSTAPFEVFQAMIDAALK